MPFQDSMIQEFVEDPAFVVLSLDRFRNNPSKVGRDPDPVQRSLALYAPA